LPLALVGLYTSLTGLDAASQVRGLYLDRLERELAALHAADLAAGDAQSTDVIAPAFRQLTHPFYQRDKPRRRIALVVFHPYALSGYFVLGYAAFVLLGAAAHRGWGEIALAVYAAGTVFNFIGLIRSRSLERFRNLESLIR
jgi:hypothetical protein